VYGNSYWPRDCLVDNQGLIQYNHAEDILDITKIETQITTKERTMQYKRYNKKLYK
jgi:hypothetical protein